MNVLSQLMLTFINYFLLSFMHHRDQFFLDDVLLRNTLINVRGTLTNNSTENVKLDAETNGLYHYFSACRLAAQDTIIYRRIGLRAALLTVVNTKWPP